jgi:hypothetical protein
MTGQFRLRAILRDLAIVLPALAVALGACDADKRQDLLAPDAAGAAYLGIPCRGSVVLRTVQCDAGAMPENLSADIIGGQNVYITLAASNIGYINDSIFQFDVTVQNLLNEAIGTPDGATPDPNGIQVFFLEAPVATAGTGTISVFNPDGAGFFTSAGQPFFRYSEILDKNEVSSAKSWQLKIPNTVTTYSFRVWLRIDRDFDLVINEALVNPGGTISDANGEWWEIYNRGTRPVDLQNLVIADSAASGRRPYHLISSSLVVPSGGYVVLGNTTNTTNNGGVAVDYAYGSALQLANSLDAIKIARVYGADTLTLDRTQYASAAVSAQNGISRELQNPALDNSNMDGSNWSSALVTAVYGPGGRGTPKAQNSTFVPAIIDVPVAMSRRATLPTFGVIRRQPTSGH